MLKERFDNLRKNGALIHNITNYVTVNDVANILLACGASPIMADDLKEVWDITGICDGLTINIGTLNERTVKSMFLAGKRAMELNHKIVLDPVGAGASKYRTQIAKDLIDNIKFDLIRGNISEIKALAIGQGKTKGVDAAIEDKITEDNLNEIIVFAKEYSQKVDAIIVITGEIDIIANSQKAYIVKNGRKEMGRVTGTGCQLSSLINAFLVSNPNHLLEAAVAAVASMGISGEIAMKALKEGEGNASYRNRIIDAIYNMNGDQLEKEARYEIR